VDEKKTPWLDREKSRSEYESAQTLNQGAGSSNVQSRTERRFKGVCRNYAGDPVTG